MLPFLKKLTRLHSPFSAALRGYILLEMMIALVIVGVLTALILPRLSQTQQSRREAYWKEQCTYISQALARYVLNHGGLPCPAPPDSDGENFGAAAPNCHTVETLQGLLPFKSLGIAPEWAKNTEGYWLTYAINIKLAAVTSNAPNHPLVGRFSLSPEEFPLPSQGQIPSSPFSTHPSSQQRDPSQSELPPSPFSGPPSQSSSSQPPHQNGNYCTAQSNAQEPTHLKVLDAQGRDSLKLPREINPLEEASHFMAFVLVDHGPQGSGAYQTSVHHPSQQRYPAQTDQEAVNSDATLIFQAYEPSPLFSHRLHAVSRDVLPHFYGGYPCLPRRSSSRQGH